MNRRFPMLRCLAFLSSRCAWRALKNGVKVVTGGKRSLNHDAAFLPHYVLHLTGLRPIRQVTCVRVRGSEGPGSQAMMVMNAIAFARASGLTYVHTPFTLMLGADRPMREWVAGWESLFNLGVGEAACDARRNCAVNYCYNNRELELVLGWRDRGNVVTPLFR